MNDLTTLSCTAFADALASKASVPGGVGSVTTAVLAKHVIEAAEKNLQ